MTLGSGCGSKTLIRIGAGSLKSVIVYVFLGIAAYMTLRGLLGAFRVGVLEKASLTSRRARTCRRCYRQGWVCRRPHGRRFSLPSSAGHPRFRLCEP